MTPRWACFSTIAAVAAATLAGCAKLNAPPAVCEAGTFKCRATAALRCADDGSGYQVFADCAVDDLICVEPVGCRVCAPDQQACFGEKLMRCNSEGSG